MMSIVEKGQEEAVQTEQKQREREERWTRENMRHTVDRFYIDFYSHHYKANPNWIGYGSEPRYILDPPLPPIEDWKVVGSGDIHAPSSFTCEDIQYEVEWKFHSGGDRAYWDDGWWPEWYVVVKKSIKWFPLIKTNTRIKVHGAESVARAINGNN